MLRNDIVGVILAGGKSNRMGTDKALVPLNGKPLIEHVANTLKEVFQRVIIISDRVKAYEFLGLQVFSDIHKDCGPLGGIHAAFVHSGAEAIFVASCDIPFISKELIEYLVHFESKADATVPSFEARIHPLCGLYSRRCLPFIEDSLKNRTFKVLDILKRFHTDVIPITSDLPFYKNDLLLNLNKLEEVQGFVNKWDTDDTDATDKHG
jgi:molybdopterin-guanine dinucleotide biosynthesis protein A